MFSTRVWTSVAVCTIAALGQVAPGMALPVGGAEGQAAPGFVYETNQDLWGNDIPPMLTAASASECADKCVGIASCTAFTFHTWGGCFPKSSAGERKYTDGAVSGYLPAGTATPPTPAAPAPTGCMVHPNVDYYGFDLPGGLDLAAADATECAKLCSDHTLCTHFTYIWGGCYLKASGEGAKYSKTGISGACEKAAVAAAVCSIEVGVDLYGFDLAGASNLAAASATECADLCKASAECSHFTYIWSGCYLKTSDAGRTPNKNGVSGSCGQGSDPEEEEDDSGSGSGSGSGSDTAADCRAALQASVHAGNTPSDADYARCMELMGFPAATTAPAGHSCTTRTGVDLYGGDIPGAMHLAAATSDDCAELCEAHPLCTFFTFVYAGCYLKTTDAGEQVLDAAVSGACSADKALTAEKKSCAVSLRGYDLDGADIPNASNLAAEDAQECAELCQAHVDCRFFTFAWGLCYLKTADTGKHVQAQADSGACFASDMTAVSDTNDTTPVVTTTAAPTTTVYDTCNDIHCAKYCKGSLGCGWNSDSAVVGVVAGVAYPGRCEAGHMTSMWESLTKGVCTTTPAPADPICTVQQVDASLAQMSTACQASLPPVLLKAQSSPGGFLDVPLSDMCPCYLTHANPAAIPDCTPGPGAVPLIEAHAECQKLAAATTAKPAEISYEFKGINAGGVGCCRVDGGNKNEVFTLFEAAWWPSGVVSLGQCQTLCLENAECKAIELSAKGCEVHTVAPDEATKNTGCTCFSKVIADVAPPTVAATAPKGGAVTAPKGGTVMCSMEYRICENGRDMPRDEDCTWRPEKCEQKPVDLVTAAPTTDAAAFVQVETGCCQHNVAAADMSIPDPLFIEMPDIKGSLKCEAACQDEAWCMAYEVGAGGCELHKIRADYGSGDKTCKGCFNKVVTTEPAFKAFEPELAGQPDDEKLSLVGNGCCRLGKGDFPRWLTWLPDLTLDQCKASCEQTDECGGLEYKIQGSGNRLCKLAMPYAGTRLRANDNTECACYTK